MLKHSVSYVFFGIGFLAMAFVVVRTYYLIWRMNKGRKTERVQPHSRERAGAEQEV